jgi:hypothetical protein
MNTNTLTTDLLKMFESDITKVDIRITGFTIECAERVVTYCLSNLNEEYGYLVKAKNKEEVCKNLYQEGWRNITYTGYESLACPKCLDYIIERGLYDNLGVEEIDLPSK